jgi:glycosyltransferase involved in cell wall biosynthesis
MTGTGREPFFSLIVPAHNEERYIATTLSHLRALEYPKGRYEVVVVENGSSDATRKVAEAFADDVVRVLSFNRSGVAFARNRGIEAASPEAAWLVLVDADTVFAPSFLAELAAYLAKHESRELAVGGTSIAPLPRTAVAAFWYGFYDLVHRICRHTCAVTIVRHDRMAETRFDESLAWMEDLRFVSAMKRKGKYFFLDTRSVASSTRRFDANGWLRVFAWQAFVGMLPTSLQKRFAYAPVR